MRVRGTVGKLRELIANLPDDTPLLKPALDHSYQTADAEVGIALYDDECATWSEHEADYESGCQVTALIVY